MFELAQFHFLRPGWLLALVPLLWTLHYLGKRRESIPKKWRDLIAPHLLHHLRVRGSRVGWFNPVSVAWLAALLAVIAAAGPSWERRPSPFSEDRAVLVIALEVSSSMDQRDVQPSRLERAKQKIHDLLELRAGARTGLIVYAGSAHRVIPPTNDPDILNHLLDAVVTDMMPSSGQQPENVLPLADRMLTQGSGGDAPVIGTLLVIGDGASAASHALFAEYFARRPHQLLVFGVGTEARGEAGDPAFIPLQREALETLAEAGAGHYQALTIDTTDVVQLNRRINHHLVNAAGDPEDDRARPWVDAGYYLLFPLAALLLLWFRKGWTLHWGLVLVLSVGVSWTSPSIAGDAAGTPTAGGFRLMDLWLTPDQQGRYYLERGDYATAAARFRDPLWKGIAHYLNEEFEAAAELFAGIDPMAGPPTAGDSVDRLFNLGNALAHLRRYVDAVRIYDRVLALAPEHMGARKNRMMIQAIIDEIDRMSASQVEEGEVSRELGDAPRIAEGAERQEYGTQEIKQFTAEEILQDDQLHALWMRQVQQNPARFLRVKFQMQLEQQGEASGKRGEEVRYAAQ